MDERSEASRDRRAAERRLGTGRRDLDTLLDVTRQLMTLTDLDALLRLIAEATVTMVGAERATIYIVDQDRQEFWSRVATGTGVGEIRFRSASASPARSPRRATRSASPTRTRIRASIRRVTSAPGSTPATC
jgi:hypothetical protein